MAQINPRRQDQLNDAVLAAADAFKKLGKEIEEAAMLVQDLAFDLDTDGKQKAAAIAVDAIDRARK